jgi:hypothetical protein
MRDVEPLNFIASSAFSSLDKKQNQRGSINEEMKVISHCVIESTVDSTDQGFHNGGGDGAMAQLWHIIELERGRDAGFATHGAIGTVGATRAIATLVKGQIYLIHLGKAMIRHVLHGEADLWTLDALLPSGKRLVPFLHPQPGIPVIPKLVNKVQPQIRAYVLALDGTSPSTFFD